MNLGGGGVLFVPLENFSLTETPLLPVKGYKIRPMLGTYGYWVVGFFRVSHLLWHRTSVMKVISADPWFSHLLLLEVKLLLPVWTTKLFGGVATGIRTPYFLVLRKSLWQTKLSPQLFYTVQYSDFWHVITMHASDYHLHYIYVFCIWIALA